MKNKVIYFLLITLSLFLIGCDKEKKDIEVIDLKYSETDLEIIYLTIIDKDITLDVSNNEKLKETLLAVKLYKKFDYIETGERKSKFVLSFSEYEITVYDNGTICYIDGENEIDYLFVFNNRFKYLEQLYEEEILDFNRYTDKQSIRVFNSLEDIVIIEDKIQFLSNLKQVKYFRLDNEKEYNLGNFIYQIQIDEELITVYSKYISIDDNLYLLAEGSFAFLNDLKFSSTSDWLPWV